MFGVDDQTLHEPSPRKRRHVRLMGWSRRNTMYRIAWIVLFLSGMPPSIQAQLDTTGFPLEIGNKWFYRYSFTSGTNTTVYVRVKEIVDTTLTGGRIVRTVRSGQDSTLMTEQWRVTNLGFYINSTLAYNDTLTHDTAWTIILGGSSHYEYQLRRVTLFGSESRCQHYLTSHSNLFGSSSTEARIALGVGPYYDYYGGYGGQGPGWNQSHSLIGFQRSGQLFGDTVLISSVDQDDSAPAAFSLRQNSPNPFNPSTTIGFQITDYGLVRLKVYDLLGREVATLVDELKQPGTYQVNFDAGTLSSGVYFYRLSVGGFSATRKMLLAR